MQFQADVLDVNVIRPRVTETTALGAAYAAGLATDFWKDLDEIKHQWALDRRWQPQMPASQRKLLYARWQKAVQRSFDWL
jgi:glycerol kinase